MANICFSLTHEGVFTWIHHDITVEGGWSDTDLIGKSIFDITKAEDVQYIKDVMAEEKVSAHPVGRTKEYKVTIIRKDGRPVDGIIRIRYFPENIVGSWEKINDGSRNAKAD